MTNDGICTMNIYKVTLNILVVNLSARESVRSFIIRAEFRMQLTILFYSRTAVKKKNKLQTKIMCFCLLKYSE